MRRLLPILACLLLAIGLPCALLQNPEAWAAPDDQESTVQNNTISTADADRDWPTDLANGKYGDRTNIRRLYTRPYELHGLAENATQNEKDLKPYESVPISVANPVARGYDFAVRYTGNTTPKLAMAYMGKNTNLWAGWTAKDPDRVTEVNDGTGQKVAFYAWDNCQKKWSDKNKGTYDSFDCVFVTIGESANDSATCKLVEVVELDGGHNATTDRPTMRSASKNVDAKTLVKNLYAGYNLGGHFESNWQKKDGNGNPVLAKDGGWGRSDLELEANFSRGTYITKQTISDIKDRGFKAIRLPVSWYQHIYEMDNETYHIDRAWMERLHEVVDWCLDEDLYVIIDTHHETWYECADMGTAYDRIKPEFRAVWTQIANEFSGYDQRLIFEGMNEPHAVGGSGFGTPNDGEVTTVNNLNQDFVDVIRGLATDDSRHGSRLLMVTPYCGGTVSQSGNTRFALPNDQMLALSVHNYSPHDFTHFKDDLTYEQAKLLWPTNILTDAYRESQAQSFSETRQFLDELTQTYFRNVPVIYGEFGSYYCGESRQLDRLEWSARHIAYMKMLGAPAFMWGMDRSPTGSNNKTWNVYDEDKHEWSSDSAQILDMWFQILEDDSIGWGTWAAPSQYEHTTLAEGVPLVSGACDLDKTTATTDDDYRVKLSPQPGYGLNEWAPSSYGTVASALAGDKEIAVDFEGTTPHLWLATVAQVSPNTQSWKGWTEVQPRSVVTTKSYGKVYGTAYFPAESIRRTWCSKTTDGKNFTMNDLTVVYAATTDTTHVSGAYLIDLPDVEFGTPYYKWSSDYGSVLAIHFCKTDPSRTESETVSAENVTRPATCEDTGEAGYISNEFKNTAFVMQNTFKLIPPLGHQWDDGVVTKEPTAYEDGEMTYTCKRDSSHKRTVSISATGAEDDEDDESAEGDEGGASASEQAAAEALAAAARSGAVTTSTTNAIRDAAQSGKSAATNPSAKLDSKKTDSKNSRPTSNEAMNASPTMTTGSEQGSPFDDPLVKAVVAGVALAGVVGACVFFVKAL